MAKKKSMYANNPKVDFGKLLSMHRIAAENLEKWNAPYTTGTLSGVNLDDRSYTTLNPDANLIGAFDVNYDDTGKELSKKDKEKAQKKYESSSKSGDSGHWYDGIKSTLFGNSTLSDTLYAGLHVIPGFGVPVDVWREFLKIYNLSALGSAEAELLSISTEKEDLDYLENVYKPILYLYMDLRARVNDLRSKGAPAPLLLLETSKLNKLGDLLNQQNEYIKTEGKLHAILRNMFFDTSGRDNMGFFDRVKSMKDQIWNSEKMSPYYFNPDKTTEGVFDAITNYIAGPIADVFTKPFEALGNIIDLTIHAPNHRYSLDNALLNVDVNDRRFDNLFIDWTKYNTNDKDSKKSFDYYLNSNKNDVTDRYVDAKRDALTRIDNLTKGNFWFDPSKIDKRYDDIVNKDDFGLIGNLTYGLAANVPLLGSSFSDLKDFALSIGTDAAASKVVAPIVIGIASGGRGLLRSIGRNTKNFVKGSAQVLKENLMNPISMDRVREIYGIGKSAETAASEADKASALSSLWNGYKTSRNIIKSINRGMSIDEAANASGLSNPVSVANAIKGVRLAEVGTLIYLTNQMRKNESNAEVMDAYSSRIMQSMMNGNVDVKKVFDSADNFLKQAGINPDSLDDLQKLLAILGFNIQTGDPAFEAMKKEARRGLNKVYNDNMTLAAMDYWEVLPYLPFVNSAIRDWGRRLSNKLGRSKGLYGRDLIAKESGRPYRMFDNHLGNSTANRIADDYLQSIIDRTAGRLVDDKLTKATLWMLGRFIGKDGKPNLARIAAFDNASRYIGRKFKLMFSLGAKEGVEEGLQQIILSDYLRGLYDDYTENPSNFDPGSFIKDLDLGANAILSYFGLNFGNPYNGDDDLRHAMNVGFAVSQMFRAPAALSNLHKSNDDNLRNAIAQLRTDRVLARMTAENYGRVEDQDHVGIFFDAMQKRGVTAERLLGSLTAMKLANKNVENSGVKDEYIDNDMRLLADTDYIMRSKYTKDSLNRLGIKKGSDDHRMYVQNAVRTTRDFCDIYTKELQQGTSTNDIVRDVIDKIKSNSLDDSNASLNEILDNIRVQWGVKLAARKLRSAELKNKYISDNKDSLDKELDQTNPLDVWMEQDPHQAFYDKKWDEYRSKKYRDLINSAEASDKKGDEKSADAYRLEAELYKDYSNSKIISDDEASYKGAIMSNIFAIHKLQILRQVLKALKDRLEFNNLLSRETGTDMDTSNLGSMVKYIEDDIKRTEKIITPLIEKEFAEDFGEINGFDDYDTQMKSYFTNRAMRLTLQPMAQAYDPSIFGEESYVENKEVKTKSGDYVLPPNVELSTSYIRWNELTKADLASYIAEAKQRAADNGKSEPSLKEIRKQYRDEHLEKISLIRSGIANYKVKLRKLQLTPQSEQTQALRDEIKDARLKIYDAIIQHDLNNGHIRNYIVNKREQENPNISGQTIDDALDGDPKARELIKQAMDNEQQNTTNNGAEDSGTNEVGDEEVSHLQNTDETTADIKNNVAGASLLDILKAAQAVKEASTEQKTTDDDINAVNNKMSGLSAEEKARQKKIASKLNLNETVSQVLGEDDKSNDLDKDLKKQAVDLVTKDKAVGELKQEYVVGKLNTLKQQHEGQDINSIHSVDKENATYEWQKYLYDKEKGTKGVIDDAIKQISKEGYPSMGNHDHSVTFNDWSFNKVEIKLTDEEYKEQQKLFAKHNAKLITTSELHKETKVLGDKIRQRVLNEFNNGDYSSLVDSDYIENEKKAFENRQRAAEQNSSEENSAVSEIQFNLFDKSEYGNGTVVWNNDVSQVVVHREINETEPFNSVVNPGVEVDYGILKPWKGDPSKVNVTSRIYVEGHRDKGYFEVVKDLEKDVYSVHFKPADSKNPHAFSDDEKAVLFAAVANIIPSGSLLSTHGEISPGGIHGLNRFLNLGFHKVGERTIKTKDGKDVAIPILEKHASDLHRVSLDFEDFLNDPIPVAINKSMLDAYFIPDEFADANIYSVTYNSGDSLHSRIIISTDKGDAVIGLKNQPWEDQGQESPSIGTFDGTIGTLQQQEDTTTLTAADNPVGDEEQTTESGGAEDIGLTSGSEENSSQNTNSEELSFNEDRDKVSKITNPDVSKFGGYMSGNTFLLTYDGLDVASELLSQILDDQTIFMDDFVNQFGSAYADNAETDTNEENTTSREVVRSHYSGTNFLYDPKSTKVGYPRVVKNVGDEKASEVKFKYKIGTGEQLSKKLILKGWIKQCNVYYVVSGTVTEGKDSHDNLTVNLVIDDNKGKATYLLAMRTPGVVEYLLDPNKPADSYNLRIDNQLYVLQKRLAMTGIGSVDKHGNFVDRRIGALYAKNLLSTVNFEYGRYNNLADKGSNVKEFTPEYEQDAMLWYTNLLHSKDPKDRDKAAMIEYQARVKSRRSGVSPDQIMSPKDIENVINELRVNRNKIIDAYCSKDANGNLVIPKTISDHVKPELVTTSNGRFIDQREDPNDETSNPVFRHLDGDDNGFGLSSDIEKLTAQIESGDENAEFGIGTGAFGNLPYAIVPAQDDSKIDQYPGKGLAGKIYYILSNKLMPGSNIKLHRMPVLLHESTFKYQTKSDGSRLKIVSPEDVKLVLDPETGKLIDSSQQVSAAEAILYLMFGKVDYLGMSLSQDEIKALLSFIINNGEGTFLYTSGRHRTEEQIASARLPYYTLKQFGWMDRVGADGETISKFICGYGPSTISSDANERAGLFGRYEFSRTELFPDSNATATEKDEAEKKRRAVVYQISLHMHWNTEKSVMNDRLGFTTSVVDALRRYFELNPKAKEIKLFGCDDLTFSKDDFFESDEDGKIIRNKKVNGLAWLIHSGKLQTSASKLLFYAPFVYAHGVSVNARKAQEHEIKSNLPLRGKDDPPSVIDAVATLDVLRNEESLSNIKKFFGRKRVRANFKNLLDLVAKRRKEILEQLKSLFTTPLNDSDGKLQDYILLDISDEERKENTTKDLIVSLLHKKALQYNEYAKKHGLKEIDESKIFTKNFGIQQNARMFSSNVRSQWVMYMQVFDDGSAYIDGASAENVSTQVLPFVTGVYSTQRQRGKLDIDKTRAWIKEKLGIPESNSIVTSGIMRGCSGEEVFGCMLVVTDELSGMVMPTFAFSKKAGRGIGFHEAWHYVNLLINNRATRDKIYEEYVRKHPELKNAKNKEVEELLAEDFRKYIEMMDGTNFTSRVKRLYNNILDFLFASRNKTLIRLIFNAIRDGRAKGMPLDEESLKEFLSEYNNIVYNKIKIPGYNVNITSNLPGINSYLDFYEASVAVGMGVIKEYDLTTVSAVEHATKDLFEEYLESQKRKCTDPRDKTIYKTILKNLPAFIGVISNLFLYLGINAKLLQEANEEEALEKDAGSPVDGHLENNFEVSKKKNVAFRAKLFLMQNRRAHWEDDEDGNKIIVYESGILNTPKYVPFNEAWNKILDNLWTSTTYDKRDANGHYESTSLMGNVERLAKTDPFFEVLFGRLKLLEGNPENGVDADIELQNLIFGTVASQKPQIASMRLKDPAWMKTSATSVYDTTSSAEVPDMPEVDVNNKGSKLIPDERREWEVRDDNTIGAKRQLPRNWSSIVPYSTLVKSGIINKDAVTKLQLIIRNTNRILNDSKSSINDKIYDGKLSLILLLQSLCIPVDEQVVDRFLILVGNDGVKDLSPNDLLGVLKKIFGTEQGERRANFGDITYFVDLLSMSAGKDYVVVKRKSGSKNSQTPIDQLFVGYGMDKQISLLAQAYNDIHPSSSEFSVSGPGGKTIYPISQNNEMSDKLNRLNTAGDESIKNLWLDPYCHHSLIKNLTELWADNYSHGTRVPATQQFKLCTFVGLDDERSLKGEDYFQISETEDYIAKLIMTSRDMLILPTMSDKKTWYAIKSTKFGKNGKEESNIKLVHDAMTWFKANETSQVRKLHFSDRTIDIFRNYFYDELDALIQYYSRDNVAYLVKHPNELKVNYHGKVKNGRMQFGGNGGLFRYFYDVLKENDDELEKTTKAAYGAAMASGVLTANALIDEEVRKESEDLYQHRANLEADGSHLMNLNQVIEFLYKAQLKIESNPKDYGGIGKLRDTDNNGEALDLDGFELIRRYLQKLKDDTANSKARRYSDLGEGINKNLIDNTMQELSNLSLTTGDFAKMRMFEYRQPGTRSGSLIVKENEDGTVEFNQVPYEGFYNPLSIPKLILDQYRKIAKTFGYKDKITQTKDAPNAYASTKMWSTADYALSAIASHVANTAISTIECEKVFMGDPAFFKWKYIDKELSDGKENPNATTSITKTLPDYLGGDTFTIKVSKLREKHSDKTKRRGSVLSPGENIRDTYGQDILDKHPELNKLEYTFASFNDLKARSLYQEEVYNLFKRQEFINWIKLNPTKYFTKLPEGETLSGYMQKTFNNWYTNYKTFETAFNNFSDKDVIRDVEKKAKDSTKPYGDITVADAEVIIRPEMYRYLRVAMGEWTFEEDDDGYSDEKAYNIIEGLGEYADKKGKWMVDPELSKLVSKFQLKPLKMTYFSNENIIVSTNSDGSYNYVNNPNYNKMAIFPMFAYACTSLTGKLIYDRMNKNGDELDMIGFESAVKVGDTQNKYTPFPSTEKGKNGKPIPPKFLDKLANVNGKSEFQESSSDNIIERDSDGNPTGRVVSNQQKVDNPLDRLHVNKQYVKNLRMQMNTDAHEADARAIGTQMFKLCFSNIEDSATYGLNVKDYNGNDVKHYSGRELKNAIMATINAMTAFGDILLRRRFVDKQGNIKEKAVVNLCEEIIKNNSLGSSAEELILNGGVVASLMSRKLFEQTAIKKINKSVIDKNTQGGSAIQQSMFGFSGVRNVIDYSDQNAYHLLNGGKEPKWLRSSSAAHKNSMECFLSMNFFRSVLPGTAFTDWTYQQQRQYLIDHDLIYGKKTDGTDSKPNPFGIGYRIPTQGQSSIFSFIVADVLPKQSGDTIIVPREFTAQTGSDFDVDKLFLSTLAYKDGEEIKSTAMYVEYDKKDKDGKIRHYDRAIRGKSLYDILANDESISNLKIDDPEAKDFPNKHKMAMLAKSDRRALANLLIHLYMRVLTDPRNFKLGRGSIDTVTDIIKHRILPRIQAASNRYAQGGYELLPTFLSKTKMEFSTGKFGIGPYALSVTNLALTEWANISFDYGENYWDLGDLDNPLSRDGSYVADWLSAMVNAHVDVAKDPYIFDLNLNNATYSMSSFLIRAGVGSGTFSFLANPYIKTLAQRMMGGKSLYGNNVTGMATLSDTRASTIIKDMLTGTVGGKGKNDGGLVKDILNLLESRNISEDKKNLISTWCLLMKGTFKPENNKEAMHQLGKYVFDTELGLLAIESDDPLFTKLFGAMCLYTFGKLSGYADQLNQLVLNSRVDTKKFGNTVSLQTNYINKYLRFRYGNHKDSSHRTIRWKLTDRCLHKINTVLPNGNPKSAELMNKEVLDYYFNNTYLNDELTKATTLASKILSKQLYSATPEFQTLLKNVLMSINGGDMYITTDGLEVLTYRTSGLTEDAITEISNAMDNIVRFKALQTLGLHDGYPIDLVRDSESIRKTLKNILVGDQDSKDPIDRMSVFKQVLYLIDRSKSSVEGKADISDLGNNEFLLYITPIPPTKNDKFGFGRLLLKETAANTGLDQKDVLRSAWYDLLTYDRASYNDPSIPDDVKKRANDTVLKIARNVVIYAYYSTYDQNGANSFFELVPLEFRKLYDDALASGLDDSHAFFNSISSDNLIQNILARNFWWNDMIVPEWIASEDSATSIHSYGDYKGKLIRFKTDRGVQAVPSYYLSSSQNSDFFKVVRGDKIILYQKIGTIVASYNTGGKEPKTVSKNVYIPTPKAGLHSQRYHLYEFYVDLYTPSIFRDNQLPDTFSLLSILDDINRNVLKNKKFFIKKVGKKTDPLIGKDPDNIEFRSNLDNDALSDSRFYYTTGSVKPSESDILVSDDGSVGVLETMSDPKNACEKFADFNVRITPKTDTSNSAKKIVNIVGNNGTDPKSITFTIMEPDGEGKFKDGEIEDKIRDILNNLLTVYNTDIKTVYVPFDANYASVVYPAAEFANMMSDSIVTVLYKQGEETQESVLLQLADNNPVKLVKQAIEESEDDSSDSEYEELGQQALDLEEAIVKDEAEDIRLLNAEDLGEEAQQSDTDDNDGVNSSGLGGFADILNAASGLSGKNQASSSVADKLSSLNNESSKENDETKQNEGC